MEKYRLIPEQLLREGITNSTFLHAPDPVTDTDVLLCHDSAYVHKLKSLSLSSSEIRRTGFPASPELIQREWIIAGGTVDAVRFAHQEGIAFNIAGGTHHAFPDYGEGFCLLNDQAIAAASFIRDNPHKKVLIFDLDVHQGNGTARIFRDNPSVFTFSMHGKHNFPLNKETSDIDIELPDACSDAEYLPLVEEYTTKLIDDMRPDLIFYLSGVDILDTDKLGRLGVSRQGCMERDRLVLKACHRNAIPTVVCMGGGYSPRLADIVEAHVQTYRVAASLYF